MDNGEYLNLFIGHKIPQEFAYSVLGAETFSDYALTVASGSSSYVPIETEESQILNQFIEQIKAEKSGAAMSPVRVFIDGD